MEEVLRQEISDLQHQILELTREMTEKEIKLAQVVALKENFRKRLQEYWIEFASNNPDH